MRVLHHPEITDDRRYEPECRTNGKAGPARQSKSAETLGKVVSARQKINHMIKSKSGGRKLDLASDDLTALEAFIKTLK